MRRKSIGVLLTAVLIAALAAQAPAQTAACEEDLAEAFSSTSVYSFDSIAVINRNDVWVTGESEDTYFAHWDGSKWKVVRGPRPVSGQYNLKAVSGVLTDHVWAVGQEFPAGKAVILHWDGKSWSVMSIPRVGRASTLHDVVALDNGRSFAVGAYKPRGGNGVRPLVYRYNGTDWRRERITARNTRFGLTDVDGTAIASKAVWAVPADRRFALRRRVSGWSKVYLPHRGVALKDVAVAPQGSAWLVGEGSSSGRPSVYNFTALGWQRIEIPNRQYPEHLYALDASSSDNVWIAGLRIFGDHAYPYAARMTTDKTFEYVDAYDPGWLAFWDIQLDEVGGAWAVGETSTGGIVQRAC